MHRFLVKGHSYITAVTWHQLVLLLYLFRQAMQYLKSNFHVQSKSKVVIS